RPARQSFFRAESQRHLRLLKGGGDRYSRGSERRLPWLSLRIPPPKNSTANGFVRCCSRYLVTRARSRTFARPDSYTNGSTIRFHTRFRWPLFRRASTWSRPTIVTWRAAIAPEL